MKKVAVLLLCWLTAFVERSEAVDQGCYYEQKLNSNTTYYITNPGYPNAYVGRHSCKWVVRSDYRAKLTCNTFRIPWSNNCTRDNLAVQVSESVTHRYCGDGTFTVESQGNEMVITLTTTFWSPGGRFLCDLQAIERDGENDDCRCGWKKPTRIVGGVETGINEYTMMAGLVDYYLRDVYCGSTIISDRYVLTAAHCLLEKTSDQLAVLVGDHDLSTGADTNATVLHRVAETRIHPDYRGSDSGNDIGLVKTTTRIIFGNDVGPVCLPFQHAPDTFAGNFVDLLGWGTTEYGGQKSDTLQKVTLSVLSNVKCSKTYPTVTGKEICTIGEGKDACQFDSGGPVLWQNPTSRQLVHVGIISYGGICGDGPAVNTRVGAFIDWIVSMTPDARYCMTE